MTRKEAANIFQGTMVWAATCMGLSDSSFRRWPQLLTKVYADRARGAAMRLGYKVPAELRHSYYTPDGKLCHDGSVSEELQSLTTYELAQRALQRKSK